jgi:SAM-dependent methyltransferase
MSMNLMQVRRLLIKFHWLLSSQFGLDLLRFIRSIRGLPSFIRDWRQFRQGYSGRLTLVPCLHDRFEEGGVTKSEYFWQDLLVARWIFEAKPEKHVDVGSRVDGFVAHVASFRDIEVFDVRPITSLVPGVIFRRADLMDASSLPSGVAGGYCDSLSCLHALEHFGLGRYGDPIDPLGWECGFANMAALLKPGGTFYLSTPIGRERGEFNANWVFDPRTLIRCAKTNGLRLQRSTVIGAGATISSPLALTDEILQQLALIHYSLGIFIFKKTSQ